MIQSSQVNQFSYPLAQSSGSGQQGISQVEESQMHPTIVGHSLSASGGGTNNIVGQYRTPNHALNPSQEFSSYNPSALNQVPNGNSIQMNYIHIQNLTTKADIKQEDLVATTTSKSTRQRAATQGQAFQNVNAVNRTNSGSYGIQGNNGPQQGGLLQSSGGGSTSQAQRGVAGNPLNNSQGNQPLNQSNEIENNVKQKICSYSFIPKDEVHERVVQIQGGIMLDEKVIMGESNEDYLVHQNFSQYVDCNLFKKFLIHQGEGVQPLEIIEIPLKKKEGESQFSDLIMQFKNGSSSSCEIGNDLEQYQQFVNSKLGYKSTNAFQQLPHSIIKKEEHQESSSHQQTKSSTIHIPTSASQVVQQQQILGNPHHQLTQQQQQQLFFQPQSIVLQTQNMQMMNQGQLQQQNFSFNNSLAGENYQTSLHSSKEDSSLGNQSLIRKPSQLQQQQQQQQQIQQGSKIEQGAELNKSNQGGTRSKQASQTQQNQTQNQQQQNENQPNQNTQADNGISEKEKQQREAINTILLRHKSEYFSYVIVFKKPVDSLTSSQQINPAFSGVSENSSSQSSPQKVQEMIIGHNTNFITLISQDEEQLASKMIREKKLCIFLTKLSRDKYVHYLKNRLSKEITNKNGSYQSFPYTCLGSLDSVFNPSISYLTISNSSNSHSQTLSKQNSHPDEKYLNPETHLNSSVSSSSTIQQQQHQQQQQQSQGQREQASMSKCPFANAASQVNNAKNFAGSGDLTSSVESKIEVKTYKSIDMITLDNFLFQVNIDVIEEETPNFKITIFKYDISDLHLKELQANRGTQLGKQVTSLNASGGGTPFQRKQNKRSSIKQQSFTDAAGKGRDKSISMGEDKQKSQSFLNTSTSSLKNIPLSSNYSQDMLNPKNMQYETKSEIFIQKFYPTQIPGIAKCQSEINQGTTKASGESSTRNKQKSQNFTKEIIQFNQSQAAQQEQGQHSNQDQMDEEYLEQQFNLNNPTFNNGGNPFHDNANDHYTYQHSSLAYDPQHHQFGHQQYPVNYFGKPEEQIKQENYQKTHLGQSVANNAQPQLQQLSQQQINSQQQYPPQQASQPSSQILKIEIPKIQLTQEPSIKIETKGEPENNIVKVFRTNPTTVNIQNQQQEEQQQPSKKKAPAKNNKKKVESNEDGEEQQVPPSKTKKIKKDKDSGDGGAPEGKKKSPAKTTEKVVKKQVKGSKKSGELPQEEKNSKQVEETSQVQKVIPQEQEKISSDIVSLKNIPPAKELTGQQTSSQQEIQKMLSNTPSQAVTPNYPGQQQAYYNIQMQHPNQPGQSNNQQSFQMPPGLTPQQQQQYYNYQINQQKQQQSMYQQSPQLMQQGHPNMQIQQMYYNQNGQQITQQQMQQGKYVNVNGQLYQHGYPPSPHLSYSPQLTHSPYQQSQKPPTYSPSPNMIPQNNPKSAAPFPPLDLNQMNPMFQQYPQGQPQSQQQMNAQLSQQKQLNQFQVPQPKSQPQLPQGQSSQGVLSEINQVPSQQPENINKQQDEQEGGKKKPKKRESKAKKQNSNTSPSKNSQDEDGDLDEESKELNKKEKQAPKKTKKIQKKKEEENGGQTVTGEAEQNQQQQQPAKKQYQRKSKAQQQQQQQQKEEQALEEKTNGGNNGVNPIDNNQQSTQSQSNQNYVSQQQQQIMQQAQINQASNIPGSTNSTELQQQQLYYQQQSQYYPSQYPQNIYDHHYDQDYYNQHHYQYSQYPSPHSSQYPQTQPQQMHYQNSQYNQLQGDHLNQQNYTQYYQQPDSQPLLPQQQQPLPSINTPQIQPQQQSEQPASTPKNAKKGKESQPKSKVSKANQKQAAQQAANPDIQRQQQLYQQYNEQNDGQQNENIS